MKAWSKAMAKALPITTAPTARIAAPRATARQNQARRRQRIPPSTSTTIATTTSRTNTTTTRWTSAMWARSRSLKTGTPATAWVNVPGPRNTSPTTESVTACTVGGG